MHGGGDARKIADTPGRHALLVPVAGPLDFGQAEASVRLRVQDVEGRFGKIDRKWLVAGWIEPYEVLSARVGAGGKREYAGSRSR